FKYSPLVLAQPTFPSYYTVNETEVVASITVNDIANVETAHFVSKGITADDNSYRTAVVLLPTSGNTLNFTIPAQYFTDPIGLRGHFLFTDINSNEVSSDVGHIHLRYPTTATTHAIPNLIFGNQ